MISVMNPPSSSAPAASEVQHDDQRPGRSSAVAASAGALRGDATEAAWDDMAGP